MKYSTRSTVSNSEKNVGFQDNGAYIAVMTSRLERLDSLVKNVLLARRPLSNISIGVLSEALFEVCNYDCSQN